MNTGKKIIHDSDLAKVEAATDDQLVKKTSGVTEIKVTDPVSFIREEIE